MPKPYELTFKIDGHEAHSIRGEFADDECVRLTQFLEHYDRLAESRPVREGFPCGIKLSGGQGKPLEIKTSLPDEDTLSILLHRLRPFILENEPASYARVGALIGKHISDSHIRQVLREQRKLYDGRDAQQQMMISSNEGVMNSEKALYAWLNAHEYHADPDKKEAIAELFKLLPDDFMRALMVSMLVDKVRAITNLAALVAVLVGKNKTLSFQVQGPERNKEGANT